MIARLAGTLVERSPDRVVIDVSGVGYLVFVSLESFYKLPPLGSRVELNTYTHVREDSLQLFGFVEEVERELFTLLIQVTGVGPRVALAVLSGLSAQELEKALVDGDVGRLVRVPGVGRKTAERLVLELKDKVSQLRGRRDGMRERPQAKSAEAVSALVNLGYKRAEAEKAVGSAEKEGAQGLEETIRMALRRLSR